jgi:predicted  nucleic acid-binding Zn-ribbon protein
MESKEYYLEKMKQMIDELGKRINKLEEKMNNSAKDFKEKYRPEIEDLKDMKKQLEQNLEELKDPAKEAWGELRIGFDRAAIELNSALKKAFAKFNSNDT